MCALPDPLLRGWLHLTHIPQRTAQTLSDQAFHTETCVPVVCYALTITQWQHGCVPSTHCFDPHSAVGSTFSPAPSLTSSLSTR